MTEPKNTHPTPPRNSGQAGGSDHGNRRNRRRTSREVAVQTMYAWIVSGGEIEAHLHYAISQVDPSDVQPAFSERLARGALARVEQTHADLAPLLSRAIADVTPVEHAILLVAAYELVGELDVPYQIVINEAIEIAKNLGGPDGHRFINGVLDKLAHRTRNREVNIQRVGTMARAFAQATREVPGTAADDGQGSDDRPAQAEG